MSLGSKIKELRKLKKMTQSELADIIGVKTITIRKYESNEREPNMETLKKIAKALNISPIEFFDFNDLTETETHVLLSKMVGNGNIVDPLDSKVLSSLNSIFKFAGELYGEDLFVNDGENYMLSEDFSELAMNITDLIKNKINKLILLKEKNTNK